MARSACRSPAAPSSCARATSAGTRRPASTICAAAGRCSTWGPTTSPISSSCSARSQASWARPRGRSSERLVTSEPMNGTLIPGRGVDPRCRHAGIRERRRRFDRHELRRAEAQARADRDLWRRRAASWCRIPTGSAARCRWPKPAASGRPMPLTHGNVDGEFRSIGVADMAAAIVTNRPHRASGALALACARGDGSVPDLGRRRPARQARNAASSGRR